MFTTAGGIEGREAGSARRTTTMYTPGNIASALDGFIISSWLREEYFESNISPIIYQLDLDPG